MDASNIAKYVIKKFTDKGEPITNLKLQKVLFYLWVDYYKKHKIKLFSDAVCAWPLGPVIPNVYYQYVQYGTSPIRPLSNKVTLYPQLDCFIDKYYDASVYALIKDSVQTGHAWRTVYKDGQGYKAEIPFDVIIKQEEDCVLQEP